MAKLYLIYILNNKYVPHYRLAESGNNNTNNTNNSNNNNTLSAGFEINIFTLQSIWQLNF